MQFGRSRVAAVIILLVLLGGIFYLAIQGTWIFQTEDTQPDVIFHNGTIITMEESASPVEAIAVRNGNITAVGSESQILALSGPNTTIIDLEGKALLPGFIDSHCHDMGNRYLTSQGTPEEVIDHLLSSGWTSISELFVNQDRLDELRTLDEDNLLRIRVNAYLPLSWQFERFGDWYQQYRPGQEFSSHLRIGGVKLFMDGSYVNPIHYFNLTEIEQVAREAHNSGYQLAIHSIVDNSTDVVLNCLESILDGESNDAYRHRIEHLVYLRDDQIERMSELGIFASFQLSWFTSDWLQAGSFPILEANSDLVARWNDIVEAGVPSIGSTDYPWNQLDERRVPKILSMAVTRIGLNGFTPTSWMEDQRLSVEEVLRLITIDAAYGTHQEDIKGSIKVGKLADLVILSDDPLSVPSADLANLEVLMTMVGGVVEYTAPGFQLQQYLADSSSLSYPRADTLLTELYVTDAANQLEKI